MISEDILGRLPNYTEAGLFFRHVGEHCSYKIPSRFYGSFLLKVPSFYKDREGAGIVISVTGKGLQSRKSQSSFCRGTL